MCRVYTKVKCEFPSLGLDHESEGGGARISFTPSGLARSQRRDIGRSQDGRFTRGSRILDVRDAAQETTDTSTCRLAITFVP